jgi:putative endonuclease
MSSIDKGRRGEDAVQRYLEERGYRVLERNYRNHHREVDIIASKGDVLAFVEVKSRTSGEYGSGIESVNEAKQRRIISVARSYMYRRGLHNINVRFDVASIRGEEIQYIEGAFQVTV